MKSILILTDFSDNSKKAAETAAFFAEKIYANLLILYSNDIIPALPYYPGVLLSDESVSWQQECEKNLELQANRLNEILAEVIFTIENPPFVRCLKKVNLLLI